MNEYLRFYAQHWCVVFLEAILWMHRNLSLLPSAMFDQDDKHGLRLFVDF